MLLEAQNQTGDPFLWLEIEMARIRNKKSQISSINLIGLKAIFYAYSQLSNSISVAVTNSIRICYFPTYFDPLGQSIYIHRQTNYLFIFHTVPQYSVIFQAFIRPQLLYHKFVFNPALLVSRWQALGVLLHTSSYVYQQTWWSDWGSVG